MIESAAEFRRLRQSDDPELYARAAHDTASIETWTNIVQTMPEMRFWVAQNKSVPLPILKTLASDLDPTVRDMVARKRKIDADIQNTLANDTDVSVRLALAQNPKLISDVLDVLLADADDRVRAAASCRR